MKRKVVLLGPYPPPYGGVSVYISTLFEFVKNDGVELWTYGDRKIDGPNVSFMINRAALPWLVLRRGSHARIADNTHFLIEYPSLLVPIWVAIKALVGFEWVKIIHDGSLPARFAGFSKWRRALFRLASGRVSRFIVVSEELGRWLRDEVGVKQEISVIKSLLPGTDSQTELSSSLRTELASYLSAAKRVCSIGAFIPDYGFDQVVEAVEQVRQATGDNIELVLLDGDFASDEDYRRRVLSERGWITVLRNVAHAEVAQILKHSDAFIRGFRFESYGLSRIEAIWTGTPVIATKAGETRGMLTYDFGDRDQLVAHLRTVLSEPTSADTSVWAARYREEAESNLRELRKVLQLNNS